MLLKSSAVALLSIALLLSCNGCPATPSTAPPEILAQDTDAGDDDLEFVTEGEYEILPTDPRFYLPDGYRDVGNRYGFTVMVGTMLGPREPIHCSGVLISPRLVLTAGHCVCGAHPLPTPSSEAHSIIDGSRCAEDAEVNTVTYSVARGHPASLLDEEFRTYRGKVRPHPNLEVILDRRAMPLSNIANLAVIVLDEPVEGVSTALQLPASEIGLDESITIAGYGFDGRTDLILGRRRFGKKTVTRLALPGNEAILFKQAGGSFTTGSGEPCLSEGRRESMLVGITTLDSREGPAFTSTFPHREWLLSELRRTPPSPRSKDPGQ